MRNYLRRIRRRAAQGLVLAALATLPAWAAATVGTFTGGDPGEGLDLEGNFTYAVNVGPNGAVGKVGDANFTADNVPGVTVVAQNNIGPGGWLAAEYGDTANDNNLENVLKSIRWSAAPAVVTVTLRVDAGVEYKLQILEGENCCPGRGFNVILEGTTEVMNFMPGPVQAGEFGFFEEEKFGVGAVITYPFTASSSTFTFVLDGPAADSLDITDRNAILNGFTLERITPSVDSDGDGLRDDWETRFFPDLAQTASGDPDEDELSNLDEQNLGTDPTNADSDNDGLADGAEVNAHQTEPALSDTDGDGLLDGAEVNQHGTDPLASDTDEDGIGDFDEVVLLSDPTSAESKPKNTLVTLFTGGDEGEGLDLQGDFPYAIDAGPEGVFGGQIGDAFFSEEAFSGATLTSGNKAGGWNAGIVYGDSLEDLTLAEIMASISWSAQNGMQPTVDIEMGSLQVGASYKLQLLFAEQAWPRGFDVHVNGAHVANDFSPAYYQGGGFPLSYPDDRGVVLTHTFVARSETATVILDGRTTTMPQFTDHNAILNAATLELVSGPADTDGDGLPDAWEMNYFGNLDQTASGDPDEDTVPNSAEFSDGTDPSRADTDRDGLSDSEEKSAGTNAANADTDGDGLSDAAEVNTHNTDPLNADTDGDELSDSAELNVHGTDPTKADTDGDGQNDGTEINFGSDPLAAQPATQISNTSVDVIFGGDPGEGLDLEGDFAHAFNFGNAPAAGQAGDADFKAPAPGLGIVVTAQTHIPNWYPVFYGETPDDEAIARATSSISYSTAPARPRIELDVVPGSRYKLQLLFGEQCCDNRGFNVVIDGNVITENFMPGVIQGGAGNLFAASYVSTEIRTERNKLVIVLDGPGATSPDITDRNAIISGLTLEALELGAAPLEIASISREAGAVVISIESVSGSTYVLEHKTTLGDATWTEAGTVTASGATATLRDENAARLAAPTGFYRVRAQ